MVRDDAHYEGSGASALEKFVMNVSLTPELERFVTKKVSTGRYGSSSEVVREALRLLEQRERLRELRVREIRKKIDQGWDAIQRGERVDSEAFFAELDAELDRFQEARKTG